ncbi:right-handed parallel beta-helix repeat-containing protein [Sphingobacterium sp.]|uniref:right-handed parallel beta-helix repeat-containing protein n=1 Tax=Sphingobacterium sp. TaxID=341027 RepID=UPI002899426C|nr:right-handed parallel beta-helix repeat-containing protein [Sphingobacterium sp.]
MREFLVFLLILNSVIASACFDSSQLNDHNSSDSITLNVKVNTILDNLGFCLNFPQNLSFEDQNYLKKFCFNTLFIGKKKSEDGILPWNGFSSNEMRPTLADSLQSSHKLELPYEDKEQKKSDNREVGEIQEFVSVKSYGAKGDGIHDDSQSVIKCLAREKKVYFPAGVYKISKTLWLQSESHIRIESGAVIKCYGSRITAYGKNNIQIEVNGEIQSHGLRVTTENLWNVAYLGYCERAFLEFGGTNSKPSSGFKLFGSGVIRGDLPGSTTFDPYAWSTAPNTNMMNLKGIGIWECSGDVEIRDITVTRFKGEAVYLRSTPGGKIIPRNVLWENIKVYDVGFNALNFNCGRTENVVIRNCKVSGFSGQCVELSSGTIEGCILQGSIGSAIQLGGGHVYNVRILNNIVYGGLGNHQTINAAAGDHNAKSNVVEIRGNRIFNSKTQAITVRNVGTVVVSNNTIKHWGEGVYGIDVDADVPKSEIKNNVLHGRSKAIYQDGRNKRVAYDNSFVDIATNKTQYLKNLR